jgi:hypothetical protein
MAARQSVSRRSHCRISTRSYTLARYLLNPDALGTLKEAIAKVGALPAKPAFMIHTGDAIEQGCAGLSPGSPDWTYQIAPDPRRTS